MYQPFTITGEVTEIKEPKSVNTERGRFMTRGSFKLLQHTESLNEVPRQFNVSDKHLKLLSELVIGSHVKVWFTMSTVPNDKGYPNTYFNVFKVEPTDNPLPQFKASTYQPGDE
jgi:hypothetical protein